MSDISRMRLAVREVPMGFSSGRQWKEKYLLALVAVVTKVEDKQTRLWVHGNPRSGGEETWEAVAAKMPLSAFLDLEYPPILFEMFPIICQEKFAQICGYFNRVFLHLDRNNCLTEALMNRLARYSRRFPEQPCFPQTGPRARRIRVCGMAAAAPRRADQLESSMASKTRDTVSETRVSSQGQSECADQFEDDLAEERENAIEAEAEEPTFRGAEFVKRLSSSHVEKGLLLNPPADFVHTHLAKYERREANDRVPFELVDGKRRRCGLIYYVPSKHYFNSGWAQFVRQNKLKIGDVLRFRLLASQTFQVAIFDAEEESSIAMLHGRATGST